MFAKFKQAIENWLRDLIADEVSNLDHDLSNERAALCSTIRVLDAQVNAAASTFKECSAQVNAAVDRLNELSHIKENASLREHIKELHAFVTLTGDLLRKFYPELAKK